MGVLTANVDHLLPSKDEVTTSDKVEAIFALIKDSDSKLFISGDHYYNAYINTIKTCARALESDAYLNLIRLLESTEVEYIKNVNDRWDYKQYTPIDFSDTIHTMTNEEVYKKLIVNIGVDLTLKMIYILRKYID